MFLIVYKLKIVQKQAFFAKIGLRTDFNYNTLISFKVYICRVLLIKNRENLKVQTEISKYFSLL